MADKAASVRSYRTTFQSDESPISEGGIWRNGRKDGVDWADVVTAGGMAHGGEVRMAVAEQRAEQGDDVSAPVGDYDDPTAVLAGTWGTNQHARASVFSRNQTDQYYQEVEIRLRSSITPHSCTGYEVFWRCLKTDAAYAEIVRWNGAIGTWTSLARATGPECGVRDGDVVEASIVGNVIKSFINGKEILSAEDGTFASGSPGIGFNFGCGNTYVDHGFRSFEVDTWND
jgi:hypothetical protein